MPREPRVEYENALYHVTSRGNGRAKIFFDDLDNKRFLVQLSDSVELYAVELFAYVLMVNHYHLLVRTPRANLSRFMQRLNTAYAQYARYKHRSPGHQFEGRYKAKLVEDDSYLLALCRYIHLNPVKVRKHVDTRKRERLRVLKFYEWSSYPGYLYANREQEFVSYELLKLFGKRRNLARDRFRMYVEEGVMERDRELHEAMSQSAYAIGSAAFVESIENRIRRQGSNQIARPEGAADRTVPLAKIDQAVCKHFEIKPAVLKQHGHRNADAKQIAIVLAVHLSGLSRDAIGRHYGGIGRSAIGYACEALYKDPASPRHKQFNKIHARILN